MGYALMISINKRLSSCENCIFKCLNNNFLRLRKNIRTINV